MSRSATPRVASRDVTEIRGIFRKGLSWMHPLGDLYNESPCQDQSAPVHDEAGRRQSVPRRVGSSSACESGGRAWLLVYRAMPMPRTARPHGGAVPVANSCAAPAGRTIVASAGLYMTKRGDAGAFPVEWVGDSSACQSGDRAWLLRYRASRMPLPAPPSFRSLATGVRRAQHQCAGAWPQARG